MMKIPLAKVRLPLMRAWLVMATGACVMALAAAVADAQPTAPQLSATVDASYDRYNFYFENPSTFDSAQLVPHNFQQTYWGDNLWLTARARYRLKNTVWRSEFAITPSKETRGDDIDTFFLASGDVATSGTSGRIDMRSLRVLQGIERSRGRWTWHTSYQYRRDRNLFHAQQLKTVTHSQPPSSTSFVIDGAETTIAETHDFMVGVGRTWKAGDWKIDGQIDASPATYARLTTYLPFKYPGRAIVFSASVFMLNPSLDLSYGTRWPFSIRLSGVRTFSYVESRQFHREMWTVAVGAGRVF